MKRLLLGSVAGLVWAGAASAQIYNPGGGAASTLAVPTSMGTALTSAQIGDSSGSGSGILGIGRASQSGVALSVALPTADGQANEQWAIGGVAVNSPTAAAAAQTNWFGAVINSTWTGSANSGSNGLNEGAQFYAYHGSGSTSSYGSNIGAENAAVDLATSGTVANEIGSTNSVSVTGGATASNAYGGQFQATCSTPANCTAGGGIHILNTATGNAKGLLIDDQTQASAYAIYSGQGAVFHNDITTVGDGSTRPAEVIVNGTSGQSQNLLDLKKAGSSVFHISNGGSPTFTTDVNFGTNTLIGTSGTQTFRWNTSGGYFASNNGLVYSSTTAASGTADVGLCRGSAGVLDVSNGALCSSPNASGSIAATNVSASGFSRPGAVLYANLGTVDASPQVGDMLNITDASACTVNTAVSAGGGSTHSCPTVYNGSSWIAMVTH